MTATWTERTWLGRLASMRRDTVPDFDDSLYGSIPGPLRNTALNMPSGELAKTVLTMRESSAGDRSAINSTVMVQIAAEYRTPAEIAELIAEFDGQPVAADLAQLAIDAAQPGACAHARTACQGAFRLRPGSAGEPAPRQRSQAPLVQGHRRSADDPRRRRPPRTGRQADRRVRTRRQQGGHPALAACVQPRGSRHQDRAAAREGARSR